MPPKIAQVVVGLPVEGPFDYELSADDQKKIAVGQRVYVPFHRRQVTAYVTAILPDSQFKQLKQVISVLDAAPSLDESLLKLTRNVSLYYGCSWGEAIEAALPASLRGRKASDLKPFKNSVESFSQKGNLILQAGVGDQDGLDFLVVRVKETLSSGKGVLILVPEVFQLSQIEKWAAGNLPVPATVVDRHASPKKEYEVWSAIREGRSRLVVGTRSAVFAPVSSLGLIVVFGEDHPAFKQEQSPFYNAVQIAFVRRELEGASLILRSPVPSVETFWRVRQEKGEVVVPSAESLVPMKLIDLTNYKSRRWTALSFPLQSEVERALETRRKVTLYYNRRGFSTRTSCNQCGHVVRCQRCDANMIYFYYQKKLVCPLCDASESLPKTCPACHGSYIRSTGKGIEKIESELARLFPAARIDVYDRDTEKFPNSAEILIGTQAVLKCLHRVSMDMFAVIDADRELNRVDFRSGQRIFSLLIYLRRAVKSEVIVQTVQMDHYALRAAAKFDLEGFYREELEFRRQTEFPPFKHLIAIGLRGRDEKKSFGQALGFYELMKKSPALKDTDIVEPQPDHIPKLRDKFRFTIMVKTENVPGTVAGIKGILKTFSKGSVIVTVNVDP